MIQKANKKHPTFIIVQNNLMILKPISHDFLMPDLWFFELLNSDYPCVHYAVVHTARFSDSEGTLLRLPCLWKPIYVYIMCVCVFTSNRHLKHAFRCVSLQYGCVIGMECTRFVTAWGFQNFSTWIDFYFPWNSSDYAGLPATAKSKCTAFKMSRWWGSKKVVSLWGVLQKRSRYQLLIGAAKKISALLRLCPLPSEFCWLKNRW